MLLYFILFSSSLMKASLALHSWQTHWWYQKMWNSWGRRLTSLLSKAYSPLSKTQHHRLREQFQAGHPWRSQSPTAMLNRGCLLHIWMKNYASQGVMGAACLFLSRKEALSWRAKLSKLILHIWSLYNKLFVCIITSNRSGPSGLDTKILKILLMYADVLFSYLFV